jgi:hypothetical protein
MRRKPSRKGDRSGECRGVVFIIKNSGQRKRDRLTTSWQRLPISCPILFSLVEPQLEALLTGTMTHLSDTRVANIAKTASGLPDPTWQQDAS